MGISTKGVQYAELKCRTHYSFLRGASHPHEVVDQAAELGLHSLAITDRDGVYGIPKAYLAARELSEKGKSLHLIVGSELSLELPLMHQKKQRVFLLAKDRQGYGVMCRLLSASHEGREKGDAGIEWRRFSSILQQYGAQGLVAIPEEIPLEVEICSEVLDYYGSLREHFKKDDFYFSISRFLDGWDLRRAEKASTLAMHFGVPLVATNNVQSHTRERRPLQDVLTSIREGTPLQELGTTIFSNAERYLKSPEQMARLFVDLPDAMKRTLEIAEKCTFCPSELRYHYPSEWIPEGSSAQKYLEEVTWKKARENRYPLSQYPEGIPEKIKTQLKHEFALIEKMGFADYFLTINDVVEFARNQKILCQGRGSAANSIVCYCLGITSINPELIGALFERFISEERAEPPDIDVDFEHERREEVIQYIYKKYGRDRAAMVANVITYRSKSSLREVSKAFGLSPEEAEAHPQASRLIEEIKDFPRHLGIHSGGFTLSAVPLIETVPIEPARMEGRTVIQWDKRDLAVLGLQKVDILALGMLTAIQKMLTLVNRKRLKKNETEWGLTSLPDQDEATYKMIQRGETVGVFQIESRAQMGMLKRLLPENFYDLVIQIAIVRPGPIVGDMVHPYLRRRRGQEKVDYYIPELVPILKKTLGVPIFQEQVMKMAIVLADFTPGEADELRRAISAWRSSGSIEKMGLKLQNGLLSRGLPKEFVDRVFQQIQGFAEYGFPESHSASFALLAYASSYFKCHYPAEFTCALVNSQPMGFYSNHTLLEEGKRSEVQVLPVHLNQSNWDCEIVEMNSRDADASAIRVGFRVVKGLGKDAVKELIGIRQEKPFQGIIDFLSRTRLSPQALHNLAMGEAFACFGLDQRQSLWEILSYRLLMRPQASERNERSGTNFQMGLFERLGDTSEEAPESLFRKLNAYQAIRADHQVFGLSTRGHPMSELRKYFSEKVPSLTTGEVRKATTGRILRIAGMVIVRQRPPTAKGTCFATLEDEDGFLDLILHRDVFEKYQDVFSGEPFLLATGKVQRDLQATSLLVTKIEAIAEITGREELEMPVQSKDFG
jgi:error-prone DNA polymerase